MPLKIKLLVGNEIRRFTLPDDCTYANLRTTLSNLFGNTLPPEYVIRYKDEEGDMVSITSDIEFHAAKALAADPLLRLFINVPEKPKEPEVKNPPVDLDSILQQVRSHPSLQSFFIGSETSPTSPSTENNLRDFLQKFLSASVVQQLLPLAQLAQQAAQQAAEQMKPYAQVAQEAGQQAAQQLMPYAQAAQQAAQHAQQQFLPFAQQAAQQAQQQLIPMAQQAAQQAQKQLIPLAQQAAQAAQQVAQQAQQQWLPLAQQAAQQVQKAVQQASAKASTVSTSVVPESTPTSSETEQYSQYQEELKLLQDMGFQDTTYNMLLLEQFGGRTDRVIETLLNGADF